MEISSDYPLQICLCGAVSIDLLHKELEIWLQICLILMTIHDSLFRPLVMWTVAVEAEEALARTAVLERESRKQSWFREQTNVARRNKTM